MYVKSVTMAAFLIAWTPGFAQVIDKPQSRQDHIKITDHFPLPAQGDLLRSFSKGEPYILPAPLEDTFTLHSNPTATKVIYLDFDGHSIIWRGDDFFYVPFNVMRIPI